MLHQTKIVTRLIAGFSLVLLSTLLLGVVGARSIANLTEMTAEIFRHPFTVTTAILEVKSEFLTAQRIMTGLVHNTSPADVDRVQRQLLAQKDRVDKSLGLVRERYLGPSAEVEHVDRTLAEWRTARDETIDLVRAGRRAEAIALNEGRNALLADAVLKHVSDISEFAANKAYTLQTEAQREGRATVWMIWTAIVLTMAGGVAVTLLVTRSVRNSLRHAVVEVQRLIEGSGDKARVAEAIGAGDLSQEITPSPPLQLELHRLPDDELGSLLKSAVRLSETQCTLDQAFAQMTVSLRHGRETEQAADWLKSGLNELNALLRGEQLTTEMADKIIGFLVQYLKAGVGALYLFDARAEQLDLTAGYAITPGENPGDHFRLGEGLLGQAARDRKTICLSEVPADYLPIGSALGEAVPKMVAAIPLVHGNVLVGALEIGGFRDFSAVELEFLDLARDAIAVGLSVNQARQRLSELLDETRQQAEELRVQQEELQQSNEELEERAQMLEQQRENIRAKNQEIEVASENLRQKAEELERVSTYKSEFLANMSHELRTPLNSLMILSGLLKENKDGNLSERQVEFASTIHAAGTDLLNLINDILDLSKVEAGQMRFQSAEIELSGLCASLRSLFSPQAEQKHLVFSVDSGAGVPPSFEADEQRVLQILKNLLSNSLKFTEQGEVSLRVAIPSGRDNPLPVPAIAFVVRDTGIGIPPAKQELIFNAFQQADGSISRKYGGTGLGLSISLQLARKMQGDIRMVSREGEGSEFTLYLPLAAEGEPLVATGWRPPGAVQQAMAPPRVLQSAPQSAPLAALDGAEAALGAPSLPDDRAHLNPGDRSILVVDDDLNFARILGQMIRERGFAVLAAADGESGIAIAERYLPSAIILDVMLPRLDGWSVMRRLKDNPRTRHIPVHFITCLEDRQRAMAMAAIGFVTKPVGSEQLNEVFQAIEGSVARSVRKLLIVEDDQDEAYSMVALLDDKDIEIAVATSGEQAIELLAAQSFDCMVLDLGLSDMSGFDLLEHMKRTDPARRIPIIIHSGRDLSYEDERRLRRFAESIIIKGAKSPERLLNEVSLFLHLVESKLHPDKRRMIRSALDKEAMLEGRKVLLVDDDMRNLFSLSNVLAEKNMTVIEAVDGRDALARLDANPDVAIVLMDIMMPDTDGYTAMREIRKDRRFTSLPMIAMTAKAMKGDYEKCMAAGASDYIAKPIDVDKLLSLIRVWIYQRA